MKKKRCTVCFSVSSVCYERQMSCLADGYLKWNICYRIGCGFEPFVI